MEDKKLLTNTELEKVAGGRAKLDENVQDAFLSAEFELESIINRAGVNFRSNVDLMLNSCRQALDGILSVDAALDSMQHYCNKINIHDRWAPQNILDQLKSSLGR